MPERKEVSSSCVGSYLFHLPMQPSCCGGCGHIKGSRETATLTVPGEMSLPKFTPLWGSLHSGIRFVPVTRLGQWASQVNVFRVERRACVLGWLSWNTAVISGSSGWPRGACVTERRHKSQSSCHIFKTQDMWGSHSNSRFSSSINRMWLHSGTAKPGLRNQNESTESWALQLQVFAVTTCWDGRLCSNN